MDRNWFKKYDELSLKNSINFIGILNGNIEKIYKSNKLDTIENLSSLNTNWHSKISFSTLKFEEQLQKLLLKLQQNLMNFFETEFLAIDENDSEKSIQKIEMFKKIYLFLALEKKYYLEFWDKDVSKFIYDRIFCSYFRFYYFFLYFYTTINKNIHIALIDQDNNVFEILIESVIALINLLNKIFANSLKKISHFNEHYQIEMRFLLRIYIFLNFFSTKNWDNLQIEMNNCCEEKALESLKQSILSKSKLTTLFYVNTEKEVQGEISFEEESEEYKNSHKTISSQNKAEIKEQKILSIQSSSFSIDKNDENTPFLQEKFLEEENEHILENSIGSSNSSIFHKKLMEIPKKKERKAFNNSNNYNNNNNNYDRETNVNQIKPKNENFAKYLLGKSDFSQKGSNLVESKFLAKSPNFILGNSSVSEKFQPIPLTSSNKKNIEKTSYYYYDESNNKDLIEKPLQKSPISQIEISDELLTYAQEGRFKEEFDNEIRDRLESIHKKEHRRKKAKELTFTLDTLSKDLRKGPNLSTLKSEISELTLSEKKHREKEKLGVEMKDFIKIDASFKISEKLKYVSFKENVTDIPKDEEIMEQTISTEENKEFIANFGIGKEEFERINNERGDLTLFEKKFSLGTELKDDHRYFLKEEEKVKKILEMLDEKDKTEIEKKPEYDEIVNKILNEVEIEKQDDKIIRKLKGNS